MNDIVEIDKVKSLLVKIRGQETILDRDVAALYDVKTKEVNQAVRNNPDKFPDGFVIELSDGEVDALRSRFLTLEQGGGRGRHSKHGYKVFTECGLYMLATILKGRKATAATLAIVNAYAQLRSMVRDMESLQKLKDGSPAQGQALTQAGHKLAALIGENLSTESTKTTIELNLAVLKISHEVTRTKTCK